MIIPSRKFNNVESDLIEFLSLKLNISENAIELGLRQSEMEQAPLPIVLWSFGLINLKQYEQVLDWQYNQS